MSSAFPLYQFSYDLASLLVGVGNFFLYSLGALLPPLSSLADWLGSAPVLNIFAILVEITIMILFSTILNLLIVLWIERKMYGRLQDRRGIMLAGPWLKGIQKGTGFLQNVADGLKLFQKENITPEKADKWMFHAAPALIVASSILIFAALPFSEGFLVANLDAGIVFIMAAFSLTPMAILIGGWASNNKYTLLGGMRSAAQMMSYEIPILLSIVGVVILASTLNPIRIVEAQQEPSFLGMPNWYIIPQFLGLIIFLISMVAEVERIPFDIPEAEAELVEGWTTEYGGIRFGLIYMIKWLRTFAGAALVTLLFLGGWDGPILPQEIWFLLKTYVVFIVFVWITWSLPRVRIDQILNIGWRRLLPLSLINIIIAGLLHSWGLF